MKKKESRVIATIYTLNLVKSTNREGNESKQVEESSEEAPERTSCVREDADE